MGGRSVGQDKPKKVCLVSHEPPSGDHQSLCCCRNEHGVIQVTCVEEQPKIAVGLSTGAVPSVSSQILKQNQGRQMLYSLLTEVLCLIDGLQGVF